MIMVQYSLHVIVEKFAECISALILLLYCWIKKKLPQPTATVPSRTAKEEDDRVTKTSFIQTVIPSNPNKLELMQPCETQ